MPFRATVFKTAALPLCDLSAHGGEIENISQSTAIDKSKAFIPISPAQIQIAA